MLNKEKVDHTLNIEAYLEIIPSIQIQILLIFPFFAAIIHLLNKMERKSAYNIPKITLIPNEEKTNISKTIYIPKQIKSTENKSQT